MARETCNVDMDEIFDGETYSCEKKERHKKLHRCKIYGMTTSRYASEILDNPTRVVKGKSRGTTKFTMTVRWE